MEEVEEFGLLPGDTTNFYNAVPSPMTTSIIAISQVSMAARYPASAESVFLYLSSGQIVAVKLTDEEAAEEFVEDFQEGLKYL